MKRIFALFLAATLLAAIPAFAQKQYKVVNTVKLGGEGGEGGRVVADCCAHGSAALRR